MNHDNTTGPDAQPTDSNVSERNVANLIDRAYRPVSVDPAFAARVLESMQAAARERAATSPAANPVRRLPGRTANLLALAASLALVAGLAWQVFSDLMRPAVLPQQRAISTQPAAPSARPRQVDVGYLAPMERAAGSSAEALAAGAVLETKANERRRVALVDGSVIFVDELTSIRQTGPRELSVSRGSVFVEVTKQVAPLSAGDGRTVSSAEPARFVVTTPARQITALGTKFAVRVGDSSGQSAESVLVTQGRVRISGQESPIDAGQEFIALPSGDAVRPAPRAAHALSWTRSLMAAADAALVPASRFAGGALVVAGDDGREHRLTLERYHVDVHIEDGFARTTIDQTFFNHEHQRSEGTFIFPLPEGASISRLAMYVGRQLMEGGMVERDRARDIFEEIRYARRDPALLEWIDGGTFKMRVFPIEPRELKRIILCYTQKLDTSYRRTTYRFPAGHSFETVAQWSFHAEVNDAGELTHHCPTHELKATRTGDGLLLDASAQNVRLDRDIVLHLTATGDAKESRLATALDEGRRYVMLRYRPDLPREPIQQRRHWVFLLETSADRNPLLARAQIEVMRTMLENAQHDDTFALVTAGSATKTWSEAAKPVSADNISAAVAFAEQSHLLGALDLEKALIAALIAPRRMIGEDAKTAPARAVTLMHLGSAAPVLGKRDAGALVDLIPAEVAYVGVQVGSAGNRAFMREAAAKTGGYVTQINPDEEIAWRAFDLVSTLRSPRLLDVKVTAIPTPAGQSGFLLLSDAVVHGDEICAVARMEGKPDAPAAMKFLITGRLNGAAFERTIEVKDATHVAGYLPRVWARLEIDRLAALPVAKDDAKAARARREEIVTLSKAMHVMSPFTSLLVLENEAMYAQYKVERTKRTEWAPYPAPALLEDPKAMLAVKPAPAPVNPDPAAPPPATPGEAQDNTDAIIRRQVSQTERHDSVQRLLHRAQELRRQQDYERSLQLISQALFLDPNNPAAESMKLMIEDTQIAERSREDMRTRNLRLAKHPMETIGGTRNPYLDIPGSAFRPRPRNGIRQEQEEALWPGPIEDYTRSRAQRFARHQMEMIEATIPYNELITYPSDWPQLTATRLGALDSASGDSKINRRIALKLQDPLPVSFDGNKLVNVIDYFRNTTGVNFFVNWAALESAGVEQELPITLQLNTVPAEQALRLVLSQAAGAGALEPIGFSIIEGVVHISTKKDLFRTTDTRVYDLRELIAAHGDKTGDDQGVTRQEIINQIVTLILDSIGEPADWSARGGDMNSLRELNGNLIIKTTPDLHRDIVRLLGQLNSAIEPQGDETPISEALELANSLLERRGGGAGQLLEGVSEKERQLDLAIAAARYYLAVDQVAAARDAIAPHLAEQLAWNDDRIDSPLFRLAAAIAYGAGSLDASVRLFERALDAEYLRLGDEVELEPWREDYEKLLLGFASMARGVPRFDQRLAPPLKARIVRAADRWRAIDPDSSKACAIAGRALHALGEHELAWAYETTPLAGRSHDPEALGALARSMAAEERFDAADLAYAAAFEVEPTNPNWLWERAVMLRAAKRADEADALLRQIAAGTWQTRFEAIVRRAKESAKPR